MSYNQVKKTGSDFKPVNTEMGQISLIMLYSSVMCDALITRLQHLLIVYIDDIKVVALRTYGYN